MNVEGAAVAHGSAAGPQPPAVPAPPPGPGVFPPFVAPPTDGARQRRWWSLGLAGGAALVLCLGGLVGLGGLVVLGNQAQVEQSQAAVTHFLDALRLGDFSSAYEMQCDSEKQRVSRTRFEVTYNIRPRITSFQVGDPEISQELVVPANLVFETGGQQTVKYRVEADTSASNYKVCGEVD
jgi:hypothetical protein